jgi:hypothetical protein
VNPGSGDFHLRSNSPARNSGVESDVYNTFLARYGLDIRVDYDAQPRPADGAWDLGAFED